MELTSEEAALLNFVSAKAAPVSCLPTKIYQVESNCMSY
jgi:hypothetical protein